MILPRWTPSARRLTLACCTFVAFLAMHTVAQAAPVTFTFVTEDAGNPFGHGGFVFDDDDFPFPYKVIKFNHLAPNVFLDFWYSDPFIGTFGRDDASAYHFEIGLFPSGLWNPTGSLWAFVIANGDNSRAMIGSVNGLDPNGNLNTALYIRDDVLSIAQFQQKNVTVFFPQVPEPGTLLLLSAAAFAAFRRRTH
jgi:hypothetical protein